MYETLTEWWINHGMFLSEPDVGPSYGYSNKTKLVDIWDDPYGFDEGWFFLNYAQNINMVDEDEYPDCFAKRPSTMTEWWDDYVWFWSI